MARDRYAVQLELLVRAIPIVADEPAFALKGGTAINLFYRDMPRLSVDIDLTYLPLDQRAIALPAIDSAFDRMVARARETLRGVDAQRIAGGGDGDTRLMLRSGAAEIKIEVSPVTRGTVAAPRTMQVTDAVEEAFGFAEMSVVAFEDLYAGKVCAALDRQHPRDLFDVQLLYENEGLTDDLFRTFLVYAACSKRPLHELTAQVFRAELGAVVRSASPLLISLLAIDGLTLDDAMALIDPGRSWPRQPRLSGRSFGHPARNHLLRYYIREMPLGPLAEPPWHGHTFHRADGDYVTMKIVDHSLELKAKIALVWLETRFGELRVQLDEPFPETLATACVGRPLEEVVDHEAWQWRGWQIVDVEEPEASYFGQTLIVATGSAA
ncbi:nucleotidyl transferase AbiEii/AbiGii toxin family protein [uncultured Sphingomonas sp.]|uniref:nucleotidyl transferase AbiEii/AbiGii toxin family protein n=1 Tax=uncultured Sphingomonas sp. TaxID=158754 RepID=UPI0035C9540E